MSISIFFQAEDGIRDLVRSRELGDVYKRQEKGTGKGDRFIYDRKRGPEKGTDLFTGKAEKGTYLFTEKINLSPFIGPLLFA